MVIFPVVNSPKKVVLTSLITVLAPNGEEFPFAFSVKEMVAESKKGKSIEPGAEFSGPTTTPSYRSADFLDPKSRAKSTGVEYAQALIARGGDDEDLARENVKDDLGGKGEITLTVDSVDADMKNLVGNLLLSSLQIMTLDQKILLISKSKVFSMVAKARK